MAAIGAGDGRSVMVHLAEIRHGDWPLAAPGGIGRARRSVEHDTGEVRVDGAVPSRLYSRASRAKRRRPGGARPSVALPGDVSAFGASGTRTTQGSERSVQAFGTPGDQPPAEPPDRPTHP